MALGEHEIYFHRDKVTENRGRHTLKKHYHDLFEIYFIEDGACCYFIDNKSYNLIPGDIIFVPAGVVHNTEYKNTIHSRMLVNCSEWFIPEALRTTLCSKPYLYRNPNLTAEVRGILQGIEQECREPDEYSDESLRCYTYALFFLIARNTNLCESMQAEKHYIEDAIEYLQSNFSSNVTLGDMAKKYFVSPEHFSRTFKKETGFHFSEYLNLLRLKKAESMLRQLNAATVTEIAQSCGFNGSNYFSVKFKKLYGVSPKKYQSTNKKKEQ